MTDPVLPRIDTRSHYHSAQDLEFLALQAERDGNYADAERYYTQAAEHLEAWIENMRPDQHNTRAVITDSAGEMRRLAEREAGSHD